MSALLTDEELAHCARVAGSPSVAVTKLLRAYEALVQQVAEHSKATQDAFDDLNTERYAHAQTRAKLERVRKLKCELEARLSAATAMLDRTYAALGWTDISAFLSASPTPTPEPWARPQACPLPDAPEPLSIEEAMAGLTHTPPPAPEPDHEVTQDCVMLGCPGVVLEPESPPARDAEPTLLERIGAELDASAADLKEATTERAVKHVLTTSRQNIRTLIRTALGAR